LPWERLDYRHVAAVRAWLADRFAPATVNRHLSALRGVLRECWRLGLMPAETYERARDVQGVRGSRLPAGRSLDQGELASLFRVCADELNPAAAIRDAALLAVLYVTGARRSEVVALDLEDYEPDSGQIRIRGKGNKERTGYVLDRAASLLDRWLRLRGPAPGPLFCPVTKGGHVVLRRMTDQAVYARLQRISRAAHAVHLSPHDLRRTFISDLLEAVGDLAVAQQLAGHASPATTSRYDRRGEKAKRRAVSALRLPGAFGP
jgi:site-specific recombinase XerD